MVLKIYDTLYSPTLYNIFIIRTDMRWCKWSWWLFWLQTCSANWL